MNWTQGAVNNYIKDEIEDIPPYVPIIVGVVLAVMVCVVLVAYFIGRSKQKKKLAAIKAQKDSSSVPGEKLEMSVTVDPVETGSTHKGGSDKGGDESD